MGMAFSMLPLLQDRPLEIAICVLEAYYYLNKHFSSHCVRFLKWRYEAGT